MISLNLSKLNRCDIFLALWAAYYLHGMAYEDGGLIAKSLLFTNILISAYYAVKVIKIKDKPVFFKGLTPLVMVFSIYGFYYIGTHPLTVYYPVSGMERQSYDFIVSIYVSLLTIYPFYYLSRQGYLSEQKFRWWIIVFFASCTISYYYTQQKMLQAYLENRGVEIEETTNNIGYYFLSLFPALLLFRNKPLLQFCGLLYILAFIIMSMKRGAILIGGVATIYFLYGIIKNATVSTKKWVAFLSLLTVIFAFYFFQNMMNTSDYMMERIASTEEGNSSGRDILYSFFWNYFISKAEFLQVLIGRGANGTLEIFYNKAHNDWLEISIDLGLLGVILYIYYWKCFYKTWKYCPSAEVKLALAIIGLIFFTKSFFSMSYSGMTYVCTSVLGYYLSKSNEYDIQNI